MKQLAKIESYFTAFYLWSSETRAVNDPFRSAYVDALNDVQGMVERENTIRGSAEKLASSGIGRERIIIGLTNWAKSYLVDEALDARVGSPILGVGEPGNITMKNDGTLAFYEVGARVARMCGDFQI